MTVLDKEATSKNWSRSLDPDPENLDPEKHGKRLDMEKRLEDHIL